MINLSCFQFLSIANNAFWKHCTYFLTDGHIFSKMHSKKYNCCCKVCVSLNLQENAKLFPIVVIPVYTLSSSVWKFLLVYIFIFNGHSGSFKFDLLLKSSTSTYVYWAFKFIHSNTLSIFLLLFKILVCKSSLHESYIGHMYYKYSFPFFGLYHFMVSSDDWKHLILM